MQKRHAALGMFAVLLFSYVINAIDRQLFSVLAADVRNALDLSLPQVGLASTVFTLGMGVAGIPTGYLLGKMSRKSVTLVGLVIFSAATYLTAYSRGLPDLLLYRFVSGLGEAMQLTALLAIGTSYFFQHRAVAASSLNFTFGIGAIIGPNPGRRHPRRHALENALHRVRPVRHRRLRTDRAAGQALVQRSASATRSGREPRRRAGRSRAGQPVGPDAAHAGRRHRLRRPVHLRLSGPVPDLSARRAGLHAQAGGGRGQLLRPGALLSLLGGWLGDRYDYRKLFFSLLISAVAGGLLFTELGRSLALHATLSFVFGAAISGMVYANLSAGIIKSVSSAKAAQASGLFVASLYIPAAFAGYLLGHLKGGMGWTLAGILQVSGCALLAALLAIMAGARRAD